MRIILHHSVSDCETEDVGGRASGVRSIFCCSGLTVTVTVTSVQYLASPSCNKIENSQYDFYTDKAATDHMIAAGPNAFVDAGAATGSSDGMQIVSVTPAASEAVHSQELANGAAFAADRAQREARLVRPEFVFPAKGVWTSGFGYRWGVLHAGIDIANAIGTPIMSAEDGVVTDAGAAAGFGAWVKIRGADGTVTLYGHVNTWLVSVGQRVMAGDQIATIGNRGDSTGPHLHFGVLKNGTDYIDPVPWLAAKGLSPGNYVG